MAQRDYAKSSRGGGKPAAKSGGGSPVWRAFVVGAFVGLVGGGIGAWQLRGLLQPAGNSAEPLNASGDVRSARDVEDQTPVKGGDKTAGKDSSKAGSAKDGSNEKYKSLPVDPQTQAEWTLEEILEEKTVAVPKEVEHAAAQPEVNKSYVLACASLSSQEKAETEKARIALQSGLQAQVRTLQNKDGKTLYRVQLGPYNGKREAERDKLKLEQSGVNSCRIWGV